MVTKAKSARAAGSRKAPAKKAAASKARSTSTTAADAAKTPAKRARAAAKAASAPETATVGPRRAIFIDVENTSSESDLTRVLEELAVDRTAVPTEVTAIGNWRVVGQQLGRSLAQRGAHLVHSAPAARVPDWSDLWIAVQAGMWLGRSRPGDVIEIVSHDRAFDAVGDAAARIGVTFRRITYRATHATVEHETTTAADGGRGRGRRRRRRGGGRTGAGTVATHVPSPRPTPVRAPTPPVEAAAGDDERHAASRDHIRIALAQLGGAEPERGVSLDALTVALKAAGFQRPPGSPRLVTRLRGMKDVELLPNGRVRLVGAVADVASAAHAAGDAPPPSIASEDGAEDADDLAAPNGDATGAKRRRSRRRGGRRRGGRGRKGEVATPSAAE